ncbi:MAG: tRNA dimethylallyltransferase, partial [Alphaproteobacteria bacterium]
PVAAESLPTGDSQRLKRAMAVVRATGRPLADWQGEQAKGPAVAAHFATIALVPGREEIYAAIDARFDAMMAQGALDEVKALMAQGLDPGLPAMKALGVPELGRHLAGQTTLDAAALAAKQATRNFAKRQLTWLRNQVAADCVIEAAYGPKGRDKAFSFVSEFLAAGG